jgi:putative toxin-antitoxin system antitoxin component (TIGR02293 family)
MNGKLTRATEVERVSEFLGLPEDIHDSESLIAKVAEGLPTRSVESILGVMNSRPLIDIIPERAFRRAKSEKISLSPGRSRVLYDFARAYVVADKVHSGNGALVMRFLEKPNADLGGAVPMSLAISSPAGADAVIELLNR